MSFNHRPVDPARSNATRLGWLAAGAGAAGAIAHVAPGVVSWRWMRCRMFPILSGVGMPHHVALTFDDGPDPASTPAFLDALGKLGWRATFFCLGQQVRRDPGITREVVARGHELGVHGYVHTNHLRRSARWTVADLLRARDVVAEVSGTTPRWFRPPYGALAASSLVAAHQAGLRTVLWTSWGRDWRAQATPLSVVADIERTWHPGATVLLHDSDITSAPGCWHSGLGALTSLSQLWAARGLSVGPLSEHGLPDESGLFSPRAAAEKDEATPA